MRGSSDAAKPFSDAHVRLLGEDRRAPGREPRDRALLCRPHVCRPGSHLELGGPATGTLDAVGQRRGPQDDDPAASELGQRAAAEEALPSLGARLDVRGARRRRPRRSRTQRRAPQARSLEAWSTSTHRAQGSRARPSGRAKRAAEATIAALSVHRWSGAKRASGSAARSSELAETPPTTAIVLSPVWSAPARSRPTSARTIARWYEAARSARRASSSSSGQLASRVEQRRLEAREREIESRHPRHRERERVGIARHGRGDRSRRRPDIRGRGAWRPCRTLRPPRRRASSRAPRSPTGPGRRGPACALRWRAGT